MTSRQRVLLALRHQPPDRVPRLLYEEVIGYTPSIQQLLRQHCGPKTPREYFGMDITGVAAADTSLPRTRFAAWLGPDAQEAIACGQVDEWGVRWRPGELHHFTHVEPPLGGISAIDQPNDYPWPDLDQPYRFRSVAQQVEELHSQGLAVAAYAGSVFEQSWYLRGMENLMLDMLSAPELAHHLFDRTAAFQRFAAEQFARAGVDIIITGDDVANQKSLMMSIETWRTFLRDHLAATVKAAKRANPNTYVFYHSCGNVEALIPDLIDVGIDILNPLQPDCMDPAAIKRRYGDRLSFWGSVSVQRTMPFGTPSLVKAEVRRRIADMGTSGGFILAPAHVLGPETPWENIVAFFEAAERYPES